jgi:2,4-dienoyl-CoA reductase-like NADH-dependent reductase (Old Yellow Enzyme family)
MAWKGSRKNRYRFIFILFKKVEQQIKKKAYFSYIEKQVYSSGI